jgi:hypothetical protein
MKMKDCFTPVFAVVVRAPNILGGKQKTLYNNGNRTQSIHPIACYFIDWTVTAFTSLWLAKIINCNLKGADDGV